MRYIAKNVNCVRNVQLPEMGSVASKKDGGSIVYNSILIEFDLTVKV